MNEALVAITLRVSLVVLAIVCTVFLILYVRSDRTAGKLAEDFNAVTTQLEIKVGELAAERAERERLNQRYSDLEQRYRDLGEGIPGFADGLTDVESGLTGVAGEIHETRVGLQRDSTELSGVIGEIGEVIKAAAEPDDSPGGSLGDTDTGNDSDNSTGG